VKQLRFLVEGGAASALSDRRSV